MLLPTLCSVTGSGLTCWLQCHFLREEALSDSIQVWIIPNRVWVFWLLIVFFYLESPLLWQLPTFVSLGTHQGACYLSITQEIHVKVTFRLITPDYTHSIPPTYPHWDQGLRSSNKKGHIILVWELKCGNKIMSPHGKSHQLVSCPKYVMISKHW